MNVHCPRLQPSTMTIEQELSARKQLVSLDVARRHSALEAALQEAQGVEAAAEAVEFLRGRGSLVVAPTASKRVGCSPYMLS